MSKPPIFSPVKLAMPAEPRFCKRKRFAGGPKQTCLAFEALVRVPRKDAPGSWWFTHQRTWGRLLPGWLGLQQTEKRAEYTPTFSTLEL